jgi:hypothetical protein
MRKSQFLTEQRRDLANQQTSQIQLLTAWLKQVFSADVGLVRAMWGGP